MSLRDRLHDEMTAAMRSGDALRRDTLRMAWSAVYNVEKRDHATLTDDEDLPSSPARSRPAASRSRPSGRAAARTSPRRRRPRSRSSPASCPQALTEDELAALVDEAIAATGARSARDLGQGDGLALAAHPRPSRRHGSLVAGLVGRRRSARADLAAHDARRGGGGPG